MAPDANPYLARLRSGLAFVALLFAPCLLLTANGQPVFPEFGVRSEATAALDNADARQRAAAVAYIARTGLPTDTRCRLPDAANQVPSTIPINVHLTGYAAAYQQLMTIQSSINGINNTDVRIATGAGGQGGITFASGGLATGPGTSTSDSISTPTPSALPYPRCSVSLAGR